MNLRPKQNISSKKELRKYISEIRNQCYHIALKLHLALRLFCKEHIEPLLETLPQNSIS